MTMQKTADYSGLFIEVTVENGETFVWLMKTTDLGVNITLALFDMGSEEEAKCLAKSMEVPIVIK